jgi:hypothetical protein
MILTHQETEDCGLQTPFFKLQQNAPKVELVPGKTLAQVESEMITKGHAKQRVQFFAPDGCAYAKAT